MIKYVPLFQTPQGECFFPYEELMFDTRSEAKERGRQLSTEVAKFSGLNNTGRAFRINTDGSIKYPTILINGPVEGDHISVAICGGELYKSLLAEAYVENLVEEIQGEGNVSTKRTEVQD